MQYDKKRGKETSNYEQAGESDSNDPISPEKITSHELTAVKRDKNQGSSGDPV